MSVLLLERISAADYLEQEFTAEKWHEFNNGIVTERPYTSDQHGLLVANIAGELSMLLKSTPYRTYPSNRILHIPTSRCFYYADAMVVHGKPEFFNYKKKMQATLNPHTLVEVLSESTESKDRGEKWQAYRTIPSLQMYILVAQNQVYVEVFRKTNTGEWLNEYYDQIDHHIIVAEQELPLAEIYRDVDFARPEPV